MCGLFGWSGLKPGVFNKDKFNMLGVQNETRGKHSCGIAVDGDIYTGIDQEKVYRDFMVSHYDILEPKRIPVVLGHTRHATVGVHSRANAHPFGFGSIPSDGSKDKDFEFIGVHNGSLLNHHELATKYNIEKSVYDEKGKYERAKIDSEIILEILWRTKNFKVLSDYNGAAALKWSFLGDPDVVYYYHGMSDYKEGDDKKIEERPLYYWAESKNSLYTSSIEDSLYTIGGDLATVDEFDHNTVYKVTNGDIANAVKYKISRNDRYQKHGGVKKKTTTPVNNTKQTYKEIAQNATRRSGQNSKVRSLVSSNTPTVNIYNEELAKSVNSKKGSVYMHKLRYMRNGHRISGFWTYIAGFGFYELGSTLRDAESSFWNLVNKVFIKGEFKSVGELTEEELKLAWTPFKHTAENQITNPPIDVFYEGIRVKNPLDLNGCLHMESIGRAFDIPTLSLVAKHPIVDLSFNTKDNKNQGIYLNGELCTDRVCPLGSDRIYDIVDGNLVGITEVEPVTDLIKEVEFLEVEEEEKEEEAAKKSYIDDDFTEAMLRKTFNLPLEHLKTQRAQLKQHLPNMQVKRAIKIIEHLEYCVHNLLEVEEKE
jgi:hypothetical protein